MKIKNNVKCFISMIAIILYPSMFMYFQNMSEGHFIEILPSIGKNLILAVVLLVAFSVLFRNILYDSWINQKNNPGYEKSIFFCDCCSYINDSILCYKKKNK